MARTECVSPEESVVGFADEIGQVGEAPVDHYNRPIAWVRAHRPFAYALLAVAFVVSVVGGILGIIGFFRDR